MILSKVLNTLTIVILLAITSSCNSQHEQTPEEKKVIEDARSNFVFVEGGSFMMGNENFIQTRPIQEVILDSYSMSKYETTFREYDLYHIMIGKEIVQPERRHLENYGENFGAKQMTWQQARDYCFWLGKQLNLPLDLPSEAQWEYAARSRGLDVAHATNSGKIEGGDKDNYGTDRVVGSYPPNPLGLYDLSGGRPEWTLDWFHLYKREPIKNPVFLDSIELVKTKVVRGEHTLVNSIYRRARRDPENYKAGVGFRCVCNQETPVN